VELLATVVLQSIATLMLLRGGGDVWMVAVVGPSTGASASAIISSIAKDSVTSGWLANITSAAAQRPSPCLHHVRAALCLPHYAAE
jgi:hypothetical protein